MKKMTLYPKTKSGRVLPFIWFMAFSFLFIQSCEDELVSSEENVTLITLQFLNPDFATEDHPKNLKVSLTDRQGLLRNPDGSLPTSYDVRSGFMNLILPTDSLEKIGSQPYVFSIFVESEGFLSKTENIEIDNPGTPLYVPVFMINENNPPVGVGGIFLPINLNPGGIISQAVSFSTPSTTKNSEEITTVSVSMREGTQFLGQNGEPIQTSIAEANVKLFKFDPRFQASTSAFPGGFRVSDAQDLAGNTLATADSSFFFATLGYFDLQIEVGKEKVGGFSDPVMVSMEIPEKITNPQTGEPVQEGDLIPLWSLNERTGAWTLEQNTTIQRGPNGKMIGQFPITHLSVWNFDGNPDPCPKPSGNIDVTIQNLDGSGGPGNPKIRYATLRNDVGNLDITPGISDATNFLLLQPGANTLTLQAYPNPSNPAFGNLGFYLSNNARPIDFTSPPIPRFTIPSCGLTSPTGPITIELDEASSCRFLRIRINCTDGAPTCYLPNLPAFFYQKDDGTGGPPISFMNYSGTFGNGEVELDMTDFDSNPGRYRFEFTLNNSNYIRFYVEYDGTNFTLGSTFAGEVFTLDVMGDQTDIGDFVISSIPTTDIPGSCNSSEGILFDLTLNSSVSCSTYGITSSPTCP
ncbi:MAG: hypothetical protein AAGC85_03920 [Bacteroidota bacterium]